eukprot:TRINITY_DN12266_c1_g1_i4.p1 TRINITY_DN12266_c1_g1~~TRINITY_DN12266_c1_g1_i4.p1  ORF type:complete len:835 (+),score=200.48 TRINITY_DN12266_c1_g1_i4:44-2548(+)
MFRNRVEVKVQDGSSDSSLMDSVTETQSQSFSVSHSITTPRIKLKRQFTLPETPIEELLEYLVRTRLGIPEVSYDHILKAFHEQFIFKVGHLAMIEENELKEAVKMPLALLAVIREYCYNSAQAYQNRERLNTSTRSYSSSIKTTRGPPNKILAVENVLGITATEKQLLIQSWTTLTDGMFRGNSGIPPLTTFQQTVWEKWLKSDPLANNLFKTRGWRYREQHLFRIMEMILSIVGNPSSSMEAINVQHCIFKVQKQNVELLANALVEGFTKALGEKMNAPTKQVWFNVITTMGQLMVSKFPEIQTGWTDELFKKQGLIWKKIYTKLTHEALEIYKSPSSDKITEKILFQSVSDMGTENSGNISRPSEWCFYIEIGAVKKYFCTTSQAKFDDWINSVMVRIKAHTRLNEVDGSTKGGLSWQKKKEEKEKKEKEKDKDKGKEEKVRKHHINDKKGRKSVLLRNHLDKQIRNDEQLRLFDGLVNPTIAINEEGIVVYINPAVIELTGYAPSELINKNIKILMTPEYSIVHDEYIRRFIKTGEKKIIGQGRWVPLKVHDGSEITCFLTVTEHTHTGKRMFIGTLVKGDTGGEGSSSQSEFINDTDFGVFDSILQAVLIISNTGDILYINSNAEKITGYSKLELLDKNVKILMQPSVGEKHDSYIRRYCETGEKRVIGIGRNVIMVNKAGKEVEILLEVTEFEADKFIGSISLRKDTITAFIEKEKEVLKGITVPTVVIGEDGGVIFLNEALTNEFGWTEKLLLGKNVNFLMEKRHARKHPNYIQSYLKTGKAKIIGRGRAVKVKCADDSLKNCHLTVSVKQYQETMIFVGTFVVLAI